MSVKFKYLNSLPKTKITVPREVSEGLLFSAGKIVRRTRAQCEGTFIKYEHNSRQLVFGGSLEKKQKAMILMYEGLERMEIRFNGLVKINYLESELAWFQYFLFQDCGKLLRIWIPAPVLRRKRTWSQVSPRSKTRS